MTLSYFTGDHVMAEEERHMIEMSSILQKFSRYGPLKWNEVNDAATKVVTELQELDSDLYSHLDKVCFPSIAYW